MINKTFLKGINFNNLLLEYYQQLGLSSNELIVALMSNYLLESGNNVITNELLKMKLDLSEEEIDTSISSLMNKNYLKFLNSNNGLYCSMDNLYEELIILFNRNFNFNEDDNMSNDILYRIVDSFENELGRTLNSQDIQYIEKWINKHVDETIIINAMKDAINFNKPYLSYIDLLIDKKLKEKENNEIY